MFSEGITLASASFEDEKYDAPLDPLGVIPSLSISR
jgi:hypothetical protein